MPIAKFATAVAIPSTLALDPARTRLPENEEQPIDLFYAFVYVSDREEGIVGSNVATIVDGNPDNNFFKRDVTFNPNGLLTGASYVTAAGHRLYVTAPAGLFVVDCSDPLHPRLVGQYSGDFLRDPHCVLTCAVDGVSRGVANKNGSHDRAAPRVHEIVREEAIASP